MFVARLAVLAAAVLCATSVAEAKTLRWASQGDALTLDPHSQNEGPTSAMNALVHDPLISRDPSLSKVPGLAVSWKAIAPDIWELKQRDPDVRTVMTKSPTYWGAKDFPHYPDELVYTPRSAA